MGQRKFHGTLGTAWPADSLKGWGENSSVAGAIVNSAGCFTAVPEKVLDQRRLLFLF
jgi:hypothetical protein